jgi:hypothetical protein
MSGVFARLVARARGTAAPGLRPRLPSRFEDAAPKPVFLPETAETPERMTPGIVAAPLQPRGTIPERVEALELLEPEATERPAALSERAVETDAESRPRARPDGPKERPPRAAPADRPPRPRRNAPLLSTATPQHASTPMPGRPAVDEREDAAVPGDEANAAVPGDEAGATRAKTPRPLIPVTPPPTLGPPVAAGPEPRTPAPGAAPGASASRDAGPPDIVIHIGHIDVAAPSAEPEKRNRPRRREITGLSDYLREGRG